MYVKNQDKIIYMIINGSLIYLSIYMLNQCFANVQISKLFLLPKRPASSNLPFQKRC